MKILFSIVLLLIASGFNDLDKIAKVNKLKKEAREAYLAGNYQLAIDKCNYLLDSMKIDDDKIRLNLANAYYQSKDTAQAHNNYDNLITSKNNLVKSMAHQQLGVMQHDQQKYKEALQSFKNALKADYTNEDARYNYEMLKKLLKEQEDQQQDQQKQDKNKDKQDKNEQNEDQQKQESEDQQEKDNEEKDNKEGEDQQKKDQQEKESEEEENQSEEQKEQEGKEQEDNEEENEPKEIPQSSDKMKDMKISEEKARMILEAMKNNEIQYFQQNRRKAKKRPDSSKPDW